MTYAALLDDAGIAQHEITDIRETALVHEVGGTFREGWHAAETLHKALEGAAEPAVREILAEVENPLLCSPAAAGADHQAGVPGGACHGHIATAIEAHGIH